MGLCKKKGGIRVSDKALPKDENGKIITNWSAGLEHGEYEDNVELVIEHALESVESTAPGYYVNVVTPAAFETPENYLLPLLTQIYGDKVEAKLIDQCGCGGYVLRVWKK